jgi:alpha-D-ribose 1-methylphosphonate 5-phosphate C-P lyase
MYMATTLFPALRRDKQSDFPSFTDFESLLHDEPVSKHQDSCGTCGSLREDWTFDELNIFVQNFKTVLIVQYLYLYHTSR